MFKQHRLESAEQKALIEQALRNSYFTRYDPTFLETPAGKADVEAHVAGRYNMCVDSLLPWLAQYAQLGSLEVIEVGCGTGSSTAAFAKAVRRISGYDIQSPSVEGARARMRVMGLENVDLHLVEPTQLIDTLRRNHPTGADVFLLYAVLEHQTIEERLETLRLGWELLRPGGLLVVFETPNRLCYLDDHTSLLPFFHGLPPELAARYARYSPRQAFREHMASLPPEEGPLAIVRWGQGLSHHEFQLALGELEPLLVGSGFEQEIVDMFPSGLDEELLRLYVQRSGLPIPLAFTRRVLNLIFRKGDNSALLPRRASPPPFRLMPELVESPARSRGEAPLRYQLADQLNDTLKRMGMERLHRETRRLVTRVLSLTGRRTESR
jgi:S-adenosylmethionine-dependent methyltransferase